MLRTALVLLWSAVAAAQPSVSELLEAKTLEQLKKWDCSFDGALGVSVVDVSTGRRFALNGDTAFPQASVIKVPVMVTLFQAARAGAFRLSDKVEVAPRELIAGSVVLAPLLAKGPAALTVSELLRAMIEKSDNTATNKLIALLGMERVNRAMDGLGLKQTRLRRIMLDSAAARRNEENVSTPNEMARLFEMIATARVVDAEACREMIDILRRVDGGFREGLPLDTDAAVKVGAIPGSRSESGIVFVKGRPFVLSVMSAFIDDRRSPVAEVTRIVYPLFEKLASSNQYGQRLQ
jgi:beta-lactamase class A